MTKQIVWRPVPNGHNTGRMRNYEIQIGIDSGTYYLYNINKRRQQHVLPLREFGYALCEAVEVDMPAIPTGIQETIREALHDYRSMQTVVMCLDVDSEQVKAIDTALTWLETQSET